MAAAIEADRLVFIGAPTRLPILMPEKTLLLRRKPAHKAERMQVYGYEQNRHR